MLELKDITITFPATDKKRDVFSAFGMRKNYKLIVQPPLFSPLNVQVKPGEITTIMGASGSGKSTLLNALIGAYAHLAGNNTKVRVDGKVILNGTDITRHTTESRHIGILFQDDLLFPHLNVGENLAYALPSHIKGHERRQRVDTALKDAELSGYHDRDPTTLSGGQRTRISLMRTLLAEPKAILLDEPFSKLDTSLRQVIRQFVFDHIKERAIPALLVTHNHEDIPKQGKVIQLC